jgi:integrase
LDNFKRALLGAGHSTKYVDNTVRWVESVIKGIKANWFDDISASAVQEFLGGIAKLGRSPSTVNNYLAASQTFLNWAVKDRRIGSNPLKAVAKRNIAVDLRRRRRSLTIEELGRVIEAAERGKSVEGADGSMRAMAYTLAGYLGLRRAEIGSLRESDIDFENGLLTVRAAVSKNRKQAELPMHPTLSERLRQYLATRRPASPDDPIVPVGERDTAEMIRRDLKAAGIDFETDSGRVDFHSLRVSFASNLGRSGVPIQTARELMRHSSVDLTARVYTKLELRDLDGAVRQLPGLAPTPSKESAKLTGTYGAMSPNTPSDLQDTTRNMPTLLTKNDDSPRLSTAKHDEGEADPESSQIITMSWLGNDLRGDGDSRQGVGKSAPSRSRS